jgi:hypothetical protein
MVKIALDPAIYHANLSVADEVRKAADTGYEYLVIVATAARSAGDEGALLVTIGDRVDVDDPVMQGSCRAVGVQ